MNERHTEDIVRSNFKNASRRDVVIHEQSSANPGIDRLLVAASKSGSGKGYPDFIIEFRNHDLLIVIECKADVKKHQSPGMDRYQDYAVDGALLYAHHLRKSYDVLSIGVSGTEKGRTKVTHHLLMKGRNDRIQCFGDRLLAAEDYLRGYLESPQKHRQDYETLIEFARQLNTRLHQNKVSENHRALLISIMLIALERESFKSGYDKGETSARIAALAVDAAIAELSQSGISDERLSTLKQVFGFLTVEKRLLEKEGEIRGIIKDIDGRINSYMKSNEYRDVLGNLYVEFLRYANSDKGLGIVLTPPHIADFFAELAQVNKDSVVYDNCAGTGGFLIHAMGKMVRDAGGDSKGINRIKQRQLYGVELQSPIYPLAVSNMYIHQDGKSNILHGDCFDPDIIRRIKQKKPTVGLLNPPYKSDKKTDTEELEFVWNNLECLQQGGKCVAIVPMQCALSTSSAINGIRERIMGRHTLEAVFSMPDELFFNSNVGVVTCVMVFTAHHRHPASKEVFLGYYKDDGFTKTKLTGRADNAGKWGEISGKWLEYYMNKRVKPGLSVKKTLGWEDEWCAEAYMETDYTPLESGAPFVRTIHGYTSYLFSNRIVEQVSASPAARSGEAGGVEMPGTSDWIRCPLTDLFDVRGTKTTLFRDMQTVHAPLHGYPYVTTQATNNGVKEFVDSSTEDGGVLTVDSAVIGYCAYQAGPFSASDHVEKLAPKFPMNKYTAMFLTTVINQEQYRYNYGRKRSQTRLKSTTIRLPGAGGAAGGDGKTPDWALMERYIKSLPYSSSL